MLDLLMELHLVLSFDNCFSDVGCAIIFEQTSFSNPVAPQSDLTSPSRMTDVSVVSCGYTKASTALA